MKYLFFVLSLTIFGSDSMAKSAENVAFTATEVQKHRENSSIQLQISAQCLNETYDDHLDFFAKHKVSKFYGDRKSSHKTRQGRINELIRFGASPELVDELEPISCIGLTMKCLKEGFLQTGQDTAWKKIESQLIPNMYGTDLQIVLQKLGWKLLYWNPDPSSNARWDSEDKILNPLKEGKVWMPVWGGHASRYFSVMNKGLYYNLSIDDSESLVGFGQVQPQGFSNIPFFVGTAHAGYHVFPGKSGQVIEAHSTRSLNSIDNLEFSEFNPLASGGGPRWTRSEKYRSGVIAIPPGY